MLRRCRAMNIISSQIYIEREVAEGTTAVRTQEEKKFHGWENRNELDADDSLIELWRRRRRRMKHHQGVEG